MTDSSDNKLKKIMKPLFVAFILIVFVAISSPKKKKDTSFLNLDLSDNISEQSVFANPAQKSGGELPEFLLLEENSLRCAYPPFTITPKVLGALVGGFDIEENQKTITEYKVEDGDNLWSIAAKFDISLNTILWANDLNKNSLIKIGQKLIIPPVSGVIHHIRDGDTVGGIAEKYEAKTEEILVLNELSSEADIYIGDILVIPKGVMPTKAVVSQASTWTPVAKSYFISISCNS